MDEPTRPLRFEYTVRIVDREGLGPVRDAGLLDSALARPLTTIMGHDAYPDLATKAAALLHSGCLNHALMDGNKRLAAIATLVFVEINGARCHLTNDELVDLVMAVAAGELRDVDAIAARLRLSPRDA